MAQIYKDLMPLSREGKGLVPLQNAIAKFEKTGTADIVIGKKYGISIKDEGDYVSVRFGPVALTPVGEAPAGERNFTAKEEAFRFAELVQDRIRSSNPKLIAGS